MYFYTLKCCFDCYYVEQEGNFTLQSCLGPKNKKYTWKYGGKISRSECVKMCCFAADQSIYSLLTWPTFNLRATRPSMGTRRRSMSASSSLSFCSATTSTLGRSRRSTFSPPTSTQRSRLWVSERSICGFSSLANFDGWRLVHDAWNLAWNLASFARSSFFQRLSQQEDQLWHSVALFL